MGATVNLKAGRRRSNCTTYRNRVSAGRGDGIEIERVHMRESSPFTLIRAECGGKDRRPAGIHHAEGRTGRSGRGHQISALRRAGNIASLVHPDETSLGKQ